MRNLENSIEILTVGLVNQKDKLKIIDYWKRILGLPNGWHYDLDIIWILNQIEHINLPTGSTIIDAGAGNGLLQFILAAKGYHVISLDFAERGIHNIASKIFNIEQRDSGLHSEHRYLKFISYKRKRIFRLENIIRALRSPSWVIESVLGKLRLVFNPLMWREILMKKRNNYGRISLLRADFTKMDGLKNNSVDCLVSVSAIEHNDHDQIKMAIKEFRRVLKDNSYMFITTSTTKECDWYFKPCQGWCFTEYSLRELFEIYQCKSNFEEYDILFNNLRNCELIKKRIARFYFKSGDNGMPWGRYDPKYQPVGITKRKEQ